MKRYISLSLLWLLGCPATPTTQTNNHDQDMSVCEPLSVPALCASAGVECSNANIEDPCQGMRSVHCGECGYQKTCTQDRKCVCVPEDEETFCMVRPEGSCGDLMKPDNCGQMRSIGSCGCATYDLCVENDCTDAMSEVRLRLKEDPRTHHFGYDVAIRGEYLLVGAPIRNPEDQDVYRGFASLYKRGSDGRMSEILQLKAPAGSLQPTFGSVVAVDEDQALVASPGNNEVHVWRRDGDSWAKHSVLKSAEVGPGDAFGTSLMLGDEDDVYVGAPGHNEDRGLVFRFVWESGRYVQREIIKAASPSKGERFGHAMVQRGSSLAVGAPMWRKVGGRKGRVHLFDRGVDGWSSVGMLSAPSRQIDEGFGWSLDWDRELLVVGAPWYGDATRESGRVYLYDTSGSQDPEMWGEGETWRHGSPRQNDRLGWQVMVSGDVVAVSIPNTNILGTDPGIMMFLKRGESGWEEEFRKFPNPRRDFETYGFSMAHDGQQLVVGTRPYQLEDAFENMGMTPLLGRVDVPSAVYRYSLPSY